MPNILLSLWEINFSTEVAIIGRRCAALFAGFGVMLFLARKAEPSIIRSALIKGFIIGCSMLVFLGIFELMNNNVGWGILSAVFIEFGLALAFMYVLFSKE
jgi:hypothetical protein